MAKHQEFEDRPFPQAARQLYECMRKYGDAYSVLDWAILAGLSVLDARRATHWLTTMPNRRHPYIRRGPTVFSDEETYVVARNAGSLLG